jgi:cytochrome P450
LAQEVRAIDFGCDAAGDVLPKLPYTRAVVSEALRLYPPAFAIVRKAIAADQIGDVRISGGDVAMVSPWVLHRHTRLWKDPDSFNPSRFVGQEPAAHRFAYIPFGAGPRVCVGAQFALTETGLVLAMLIQRFSITLADTFPVIPTAVVTTQPDHPALFRLHVRN